MAKHTITINNYEIHRKPYWGYQDYIYGVCNGKEFKAHLYYQSPCGNGGWTTTTWEGKQRSGRDDIEFSRGEKLAIGRACTKYEEKNQGTFIKFNLDGKEIK